MLMMRQSIIEVREEMRMNFLVMKMAKRQMPSPKWEKNQSKEMKWI
jgi:hypothetical protein